MNVRSRKFMAAFSLFAITGLTVTAFGQAAGAAPAPQDVQKLEKFTVTGSYIPTNETALTAGVSPVVNIDRKIIDESGMTTTSELLQKITVSNGGSVPISNNATGFTPAATSVSLRGLGPGETLVLINGRRVASYPVGNGGTEAFVDLNAIPLAAVDSIEVLKDGASAIYGADAVAGVVNIKMRRGMDGTEASVQYGNTTRKDSSEFIASVITGAQTDKANVMVGFNYYKKNAIMNADRAYSAVPPFLSSNSSPLNLNITRAAALAAGVPASALPAGTAQSIKAHSPASTSNNGTTPATGYTFGTGNSSVFNFNEFSMSYPRRDNRGLFAYADRKIFNQDNIKGYLDVNYNKANTENQLAPSATGNFQTFGQTTLVIPARTTSPLPNPDGTTTRVAAAGAFNPFNPFNVDIAGTSRARLAEFGNRIFRNSTDAALVTAGVKGENLGGNWNFDAYYSFSSVIDTSRNTLDSASRFNRLMNANDSFFKPGSEDYLGTTIPYNPFGYYKTTIPNNALIAHAALIDTKDRDESYLNSFSAVISTGNLMDLPAGGVGFAIGADARHEELNQYPDPYGATGDLIGSSVTPTSSGQRKVWGAFAEWNIPVMKNAPGAHSLTATAAVRHEDFMTNSKTTNVPKVGLRWQPVDDSLTFRASWSKGFREPSLYQLYSASVAGLVNITNPNSKVFEPEQSVTVSGNRNLAPEKSDFLNTGVVWSPQVSGLKGLTLSVDYWQAKITGAVSTDYQDTVNRAFGHSPSGAAVAGGLQPGESVLLLPDGSINVVNAIFTNVGETKIAGFDYAASYVYKSDSMGRFDASTVWTMFTHYLTASNPASPLQEVINQAVPTGTGSDDGYLRWKGRAQVEWAFKGFTTLIGTNFTDGFWDVDLNGNDFFVKRTWIFDGQISYNLQNRFAPWLSDTKISVGGRNLFDRDPPYAAGAGGNSTGYPSFLYTSEGRFWYVALSRKF
jgi:iron complex outermembrane recepter protein